MSPRARLLLAAAVIAGVWQLPHGRQLLYPVTLLATYVHELGHGLAALLVGHAFDRLEIYADGSGLAYHRGESGVLAQAFIAASGLAGPSVAGALLVASSRWPPFARAMLVVLAGLALLSAALWAGNWQAFAFAGACAAVCLGGARWLSAGAAGFLLGLIGLTLCLSLFQDLGYMFSESAQVEGQLRPSDSAAIARALWLPYWVWGAVVAAGSLAMTLLAIWFATRPRASAPAAVPP